MFSPLPVGCGPDGRNMSWNGGRKKERKKKKKKKKNVVSMCAFQHILFILVLILFFA